MTSGNTMDELNALLEERTRYEKWIAQLTAKREQTPPHVFERVRADYSRGSNAVMGQLRSHGEGLQASAASLEQRATTLATDEQQRRDARAEIELRAMVGEYSTERANTELAACDADIARLESERTAATAELGRLQEILSVVRQPEARPVAAAPPPAPPSRPLGAPVPRAEVDTTAEELAFLNSVVERRRMRPRRRIASGTRSSCPGSTPTPAAPPPRVVTGDIPLVTSLGTSDKPEPGKCANPRRSGSRRERQRSSRECPPNR